MASFPLGRPDTWVIFETDDELGTQRFQVQCQFQGCAYERQEWVGLKEGNPGTLTLTTMIYGNITMYTDPEII